MARLIKVKGSLPEPPAERKILKAPKAKLPPGSVTYRASNPKAKYIQPPFLRQQGRTKNEKLYYGNRSPKEKDVDFLSKYLLQSVDRSKATDVGVERAIAVMVSAI
jgi:DNA repair protein REV1